MLVLITSPHRPCLKLPSIASSIKLLAAPTVKPKRLPFATILNLASL